MTAFRKYWICTLIGALAASFYPIYMSICVIVNSAAFENTAPKYILPYAPISIAVIAAVALMPIILKFVKKLPALVASAVSVGIFFLSELLLGNNVVVTTAFEFRRALKALCYVSSDKYIGRPLSPFSSTMVTVGHAYSPAVHVCVCIISAILIVSLISCLYGLTGKINKMEKNMD